MECSFQPLSGPVQAYEGAINTVGLDLATPLCDSARLDDAIRLAAYLNDLVGLPALIVLIAVWSQCLARA
jgi:hypothetical protein